MSCATSNLKISLICTLDLASPVHNREVDTAAIVHVGFLWLPCSAGLIRDWMDIQSQFLDSASWCSALKYVEL